MSAFNLVQRSLLQERDKYLRELAVDEMARAISIRKEDLKAFQAFRARYIPGTIDGDDIFVIYTAFLAGWLQEDRDTLAERHLLRDSLEKGMRKFQ